MTAAPTRADVERFTAVGIHATIECGRDDDQPTEFVDATDYDALAAQVAQLRDALEAVMPLLAECDCTNSDESGPSCPCKQARAALNTRSGT